MSLFWIVLASALLLCGLALMIAGWRVDNERLEGVGTWTVCVGAMIAVFLVVNEFFDAVVNS